MTEPLDLFLKDFCHQTLEYYVAAVQVHTVGDLPLPAMFDDLGKQTPLVVISDIGFNNMDRPVFQSVEIHPGNRMNFKIIRSP